MMIDRSHRLSVSRQAELLDISRGAVYYLPRPISAADLALMRRLDELHLQHPFMGARMLKRELAKEGIEVRRMHCPFRDSGRRDVSIGSEVIDGLNIWRHLDADQNWCGSMVS